MVTATVRPSSQAPAAPDAFPKGGSGVRFIKEWTVSNAAAQLHHSFVVSVNELFSFEVFFFMLSFVLTDFGTALRNTVF